MSIELKLRAHHMYCVPFLKSFPERGSAYLETERKIKQAMRLEPDRMIEIVEGVDVLCDACPLCVNGRCTSPSGDEPEVRKWDALILRGLGLSAGKVYSVHELQSIVGLKSPIDLCKRCRWRESCEIPISSPGRT